MGTVTEDELIILVNEAGEATGTAPKMASHHQDTPLHLAFTCYVFDEAGRFLLTRRALTKTTWPGAWTNSCCGHPLPGEALFDSVDRRLHHELGTTARHMDIVVPTVRYRAVMDNGVVENEIGPVLRAALATAPTPNPEEVAETRWVSWERFAADVLDGTQDISPWSRRTVELLCGLGPDPWQWPPVAARALPAALNGTTRR
ncbi:isopentenyl-diphosphate Delta-isomerase [Streptomyces sp. NPDC004667]|uniref:isopentenyl-diphosphate Delta-isomerase n=1 Tax=Streptomyces sp. NPDC004667 TaxID=3154285 RepID=UPI00339F44C0